MNLDEQLYNKVEHLVSRVKKTNKHRNYLLGLMHKLQKDISSDILKKKREIIETNSNETKSFFNHIFITPNNDIIEIECIIYFNKKTYSLFPKGKNGSGFYFSGGCNEKNILWQSMFTAMREANDKCLLILNEKKKIKIKVKK